jgi:hypothetical protein
LAILLVVVLVLVLGFFGDFEDEDDDENEDDAVIARFSDSLSGKGHRNMRSPPNGGGFLPEMRPEVFSPFASSFTLRSPA